MDNCVDTNGAAVGLFNLYNPGKATDKITPRRLPSLSLYPKTALSVVAPGCLPASSCGVNVINVVSCDDDTWIFVIL